MHEGCHWGNCVWINCYSSDLSRRTTAMGDHQRPQNFVISLRPLQRQVLSGRLLVLSSHCLISSNFLYIYPNKWDSFTHIVTLALFKSFHYAVGSLFLFEIVQEKKSSNCIIKCDWSADLGVLKGLMCFFEHAIIVLLS